MNFNFVEQVTPSYWPYLNGTIFWKWCRAHLHMFIADQRYNVTKTQLLSTICMEEVTGINVHWKNMYISINDDLKKNFSDHHPVKMTKKSRKILVVQNRYLNQNTKLSHYLDLSLSTLTFMVLLFISLLLKNV